MCQCRPASWIIPGRTPATTRTSTRHFLDTFGVPQSNRSKAAALPVLFHVLRAPLIVRCSHGGLMRKPGSLLCFFRGGICYFFPHASRTPTTGLPSPSSKSFPAFRFPRRSASNFWIEVSGRTLPPPRPTPTPTNGERIGHYHHKFEGGTVAAAGVVPPEANRELPGKQNKTPPTLTP